MCIIFNQTTATIKILRLVRYFFQIIKKYLTNFLTYAKTLKKEYSNINGKILANI